MQLVQSGRRHVGDIGNDSQFATQIVQARIRTLQCVSTIRPFVRMLVGMPPTALHRSLNGGFECVWLHWMIDLPWLPGSLAGDPVMGAVHLDRRQLALLVDALRIRFHIGVQWRDLPIGVEVVFP
ncbi:hypothetical protein D3C80_1344660 [compost metagenome]